MTRSQSREQAFALLFEKSFNPETDMDDIISLSLENELIEPDEFASMLAQTAWDKLFSIDDIQRTGRSTEYPASLCPR